MVAKKNPQTRQIAELRSRLNLHRFMMDHFPFSKTAPWRWAQPVLLSKPKPGPYKPRKLPSAYLWKKEQF